MATVQYFPALTYDFDAWTERTRRFELDVGNNEFRIEASSQRAPNTVSGTRFAYHALQLFQSTGTAPEFWDRGYWMPSAGQYNNRDISDSSQKTYRYTGHATTTLASGDVVQGEWIEFGWTRARILESYELYHRRSESPYASGVNSDKGVPVRWQMYGSDAGDTWTAIGPETSYTWQRWRGSASSSGSDILVGASFDSGRIRAASQGYRRFRIVFLESSHPYGFRLDRIRARLRQRARDSSSNNGDDGLDGLLSRIRDPTDRPNPTGNGENGDEDGEGTDWFFWGSAGLLVVLLLVLLLLPSE